MTIELLKMLFEHKHEVLIFLRSLSKSSESFMERFYEDEIDEYFGIYSIQIKVPLISDVVKTVEFEQDQKGGILQKLEGFRKLQKVDFFKECFQLSIDVVISKFKRGYHTLDQSTVQTCLEIILSNMSDFQRVKFVVNEDCDSDWVKSALELSNPESDLINIFIN